MRKITVFSMNDNSKVEHFTNATTWGAVKREKSEISSMVKSDMKIVIKQTKAVIESEDTLLPSGDVTIYLFPGKVKSGDTPVIDTKAWTERDAEEIFNGLVEAYKEDLTELKPVLLELQAKETNVNPA